MKIKGADGTPFRSNDFFAGVFSINPKIQFTEYEANLFGAVLDLLKENCENNGISKEELGHAAIVISDDGSFSFAPSEEDEEAYGFNMNLIIYPMNKIRNSGREGDLFMMIDFTEELVHFIWPKLSEKDVKLKNIEILKKAFPFLSIEILKELGIIVEDY